MSMLSDFLSANGVTAEGVVAASRSVERRDVAARLLSTRRAAARREQKKYEDLGLAKPNALGRGLSMDSLRRTLAGQPVSRIVRRKVVRAVNAELASRKKEPVELRALFRDAGVRKGKKKA